MRRRACLLAAMGLLIAAMLPAACAHAQEDTKEEAKDAAQVMELEIAPYTGVIGKKMTVRKWADEDSHALGTVEPGTAVDVYNKGRTWTRIAFGEAQGYVLTKYVERVQRKNPFDGPMPGTSKHVAVGFVREDTWFKPEGYKYAIDVRAGSWLSIESLTEDRAYFPYKREPDNVSVPREKLTIYEFVPWDAAQPGDLLYAFTSFYTTSLKKEGNAGRLHNIQLAADRITSVIVPAGECFSFNAICGPYEEENGYRSAPILSGESEMGYGGGVCQVCSTIYNIVLRIPTYIEEMHWHSQGGVSYLPAGFDATVGSESDMVFRNILPYGLRIEFENLDGTMTAFFFRE